MTENFPEEHEVLQSPTVTITYARETLLTRKLGKEKEIDEY